LPLDRQSIEKRDFPIGRRGYDPDAVDSHLRAVAVEVDELRRSARSGGGAPASLATTAAESVRTIVEAAETSAAQIRDEAEDEARLTRQRADQDAQRARDDAAAQARDHVSRVHEATKAMLQRVEAMESELGALVESLRTGSNRLSADLALLQGNMGELRTASTGAEAEEEPAPAAPEPEPVPAAESAGGNGGTEAITAERIEPEPEPVMAEPGGMEAGEGDPAEGARLVALNMALNGTPRDETDRYLAENFDLANREQLLDEVYASVE
jgi:cell division septum initiation protein DivIVA